MILTLGFVSHSQPRRPTDSPFGLRETVPGEEIVRPAGVYAYWTLVVLPLGRASRANAPQLFSAKGAAFSVSLGQRLRNIGAPKPHQR
jgi:hypothetical protein